MKCILSTEYLNAFLLENLKNHFALEVIVLMVLIKPFVGILCDFKWTTHNF